MEKFLEILKLILIPLWVQIITWKKVNWSGFGIESATEIENWQILSPTRTAGYGTKVLNQKNPKGF